MIHRYLPVKMLVDQHQRLVLPFPILLFLDEQIKEKGKEIGGMPKSIDFGFEAKPGDPTI